MQVAEKLSKKDEQSKVEVTVAKIKQSTLEQEKEEQLKKIKEVKDMGLPPISGGALPSLAKGKGNFEIDADYLAKAQRELDRLADFDQPKVKL